MDEKAPALLHSFCAKLQDALADKGYWHSVTWEVHPTGCINIFIGEVECYTIYPNTNEWIVTYFK